MYTRTDETLADIIAYGQPNLGMQPFGQALWRHAFPQRYRFNRHIHAIHLG